MMTERLEKAQKPRSWSVGKCHCCELNEVPITVVKRNDFNAPVSLCGLCVQIPGALYRTLTREDLYRAQSVIYHFLITRVGIR
jgi:hypothetical protein